MNAFMNFIAGVPQRVNGKVLGNLNGVELNSVDLHTYVVTSDGRAYTAISRVEPDLGTSMLSLYSIGSVFGWLFGALTSPSAKNGFTITGNSSIDNSDNHCHRGCKRTFLDLTIKLCLCHDQGETSTERW